MPTRIQTFGLKNGIKPKSKMYNLSDLIQDSYKVSYAAKKVGNKTLIDLTESHLVNIKKDPTKTKTLSEDLDTLKGLVKLGKNQELKDLEEVDTTKKTRKRSLNSAIKPATVVKESWDTNRTGMKKALQSFRESAKSKVFYKELHKFNKNINSSAPFSMTEAINLYKACNSCLTHLTVELERKPSFRKSYKECTKLLSRDTLKLLEAIQSNKLPNKSLLESFITFTNILLESNTPEKLNASKLAEDADMEELDDRDVINEDADMEELDDRDVINEDADMEELDDRDVINEGDEEELPVEDLEEEDYIEDEELPVEDLEEGVSVDLTPEEISILQSILGKISGLNETEEEELPVEDLEEEDYIEDEIPEEELEEEDYIEDEELPVEDLEEDEEEEEELPVEDLEEDEEEEELPDEDLVEGDEEEIPEEELDESEEEEIPEEDLEESEEEEIHDYDTELTESAINRIKKCF